MEALHVRYYSRFVLHSLPYSSSAINVILTLHRQNQNGTFAVFRNTGGVSVVILILMKQRGRLCASRRRRCNI